MPSMKTVISTGVMNSLTEMRVSLSREIMEPNMPLPARIGWVVLVGREAMSACLPIDELRSTLVDADPDNHVTDLLDEARLAFDLLARRVRPFVIDPTLAILLGEIEHLLDESLAVGVLQVEEHFADPRLSDAVRDGRSAEIEDENVEVAVDESAGLIVEGLERLVLAVGGQQFHGPIDHGLRLVGGSIASRQSGETCPRQGEDREGDRHEFAQHVAFPVALLHCSIRQECPTL